MHDSNLGLVTLCSVRVFVHIWRDEKVHAGDNYQNRHICHAPLNLFVTDKKEDYWWSHLMGLFSALRASFKHTDIEVKSIELHCVVASQKIDRLCD